MEGHYMMITPKVHCSTPYWTVGILLTSLHSEETEEAPTTYIWLLYFLSQLYLHLGEHAAALQYVNTALRHTPVLPELWMTKARILKRSGDLLAAEEAMAQAR